MNVTGNAKTLIQATANRLGYEIEIRRLPPLTPPVSMRAEVGSAGDPQQYQAVGEEFFKYFRDLCTLQPDEHVLDMGCGCGRMAVPLTEYLNGSAVYEGFDIIQGMIRWDTKHISSKYPNFHFQLADIFNQRYNPRGHFKASEYRFPYPDESFDFLFGTSVFTHMLPQDMENYFSEIRRVLKQGGRCLISYFLLNTQSLELIGAKLSTLDFKYTFTDYRTKNESIPEDAVAYAEEYIRKLYERVGLAIVDPVRYGSWCCRKNFLSYQDIIVASRR
jgi:ubiquinone/menaquinone biosynthesis C-methylase UbiE